MFTRGVPGRAAQRLVEEERLLEFQLLLFRRQTEEPLAQVQNLWLVTLETVLQTFKYVPFSPKQFLIACRTVVTRGLLGPTASARATPVCPLGTPLSLLLPQMVELPARPFKPKHARSLLAV